MENNQSEQQNYEYEPVVEEVAPVEKKDTLGLISMICGIVGVVLMCCCPGPFPLAAVILAIVAKSKTGEMSGKAKVGLILGIIGLVLGIIGGIIGFASGFMGGLINATGASSGYYY